MTARSDTVRGVVTLLLAAVGAALLWSLPIAAPRWSELRSTAGLQTELVDAVGFTLWAIGTAAATYLVLASALHLVALACERRSRAPRLRRAAGRLTPRWMAVATVGVMTGSSWVVPAAGAAATTTTGDGERRPDVVMEVIAADDAPTGGAPRTMLPWATRAQRPTPTPRTSPTTTAPPVSTVPTVSTVSTVPTATSNPPTTSVSPSTSGPPGTPTGTAPRLEELDDPATPPDTAPTVATAADPTSANEAHGRLPGQPPPPLAVELEAGDDVGANGLHVVVAGESFWTIAEREVSARALPVPVAGYWGLLVEANRDRLVDRDDPDLIHPGQELVLP